jgi:hypothetical protein
MKDTAPVIANVLLEGVQPNDVRTSRDLPRYEIETPRPRTRQAGAGG